EESRAYGGARRRRKREGPTVSPEVGPVFAAPREAWGRLLLVLLHLLQLLARLVHLLAQLPQLSPQILIVGRRTAATRALAQSHHVAPRPEPHRARGLLELRFDLAMVAVTDQIERSAALLAAQGGDQILGVVDRAVVDARDHVARLDAGALGGRALEHLEHQHPSAVGHVEVAAEVGVQGLD